MKFDRNILLNSGLLISMMFGLSATAKTAVEAASDLSGTYAGSWNLYGLDKSGQVVPLQSWTDEVTTSQPILKGDRATIVATDIMTYPNGKTFSLQWNEGFFVNSDGSAGQRFFDTYGVVSIEQPAGPDTWIIDANATAQELQQLGIINASFGKHVTVKNIIPGNGFVTEYVSRITTVKWTDSAGQARENQFISLQGFHKHSPAP